MSKTIVLTDVKVDTSSMVFTKELQSDNVTWLWFATYTYDIIDSTGSGNYNRRTVKVQVPAARQAMMDAIAQAAHDYAFNMEGL